MKKIVIIEKIVIKKNHACNKMNFSNTVNEIIRAVFYYYFFYIKILHTQEAPKSTKKHKNTTKQKYKTQISEQKLKMHLKNI